MGRWIGGTVLAVLALYPSGLSGAVPEQAGKRAKWRFHFILGGDNDLELQLLFGAEFLSQFRPTEDVIVVFEFDRNAKDSPESKNLTGRGLADTYENWHGSKRFRLTEEGVEEVEEVGEVNFGDPKAVADSIAWAAKNYPAEKSVLVFADHGAGWAGWNVDESHGNDSLTVSEIGTALAKGRAAGEMEERFDLIVFAACLMGSLEVARVCQPHGKYLVASEEVSRAGIFYTWPAILSELCKNPDMDAAELGKSICDTWNNFFVECPLQVSDEDRRQLQEIAKALTFCVVDLDQIPAVVEATDALAEGLLRLMKEQGRSAWLKIAAARSKTEEYGKSPQFSFHCRDLDHFARNLKGSGIDAQRTRLSAAIKSAVTYNLAGPQRKEARGLSALFPGTKRDWEGMALRLRPDYPKASPSPKWVEFLRAYMEIQSRDADAPEVGETKFTRKKIKVGQMVEFSTTVKSTDDDVARLEFFLAIPQKDVLLVLGKYPVKENEGNDFDGRWLAHGPKGEKTRIWTCVASYDEIGERTYMVMVPVLYTPPGTKEEREISLMYRVQFDPKTWDLVRGSYVQSFEFREMGPAPVDLRAGGKMKGVYYVWKKTGEMERWGSQETMTLNRKGLALEEHPLIGKCFAGFEATDLAGNKTRTELVEIQVEK